jgi:PhnB protein
MQLNPYLIFNGTCAEAFRFYEQVLGGKIEMMMTHGESPIADQVAPEMRDRVLHVTMSVDGQLLMGSDAPEGYFEQPQGFSVQVALGDADQAERVFNALAEGGTVRMPFGQTFWAFRFGMLVDRFGIPWMINCDGNG